MIITLINYKREPLSQIIKIKYVEDSFVIMLNEKCFLNSINDRDLIQKYQVQIFITKLTNLNNMEELCHSADPGNQYRLP